MSSRYSSLDWKAELKRPKSKSKDTAIVKVENHHNNLGAMVKRFMHNTSSTSMPKPTKAHPSDDFKIFGNKASNISALPRKLFGKPKALSEVKPNTRTLAMVLRSERELLSLTKDQESHIAQLNSLLHQRTCEVEKLKDLCLKQREEIKALKSAVLFPDDMNSQLQELLDQQGSELKQAKGAIPTLQRQIYSLTGQLQCLSEDLAEVKAAKYTARSIDDSYSTLRTLVYDQEEAANSLDFSPDDLTVPNSPHNMFLKDVNPCLTPCYSRMNSKEHEAVSYNYRADEAFYEGNVAARKLSTTSDQFTISGPETEAFCRSEEGRYRD